MSKELLAKVQARIDSGVPSVADMKLLREIADYFLPPDVRRLVIAGRRAFDLGYPDEEFNELDQALEAFSDRVPYDPE